MSGPVTGTDATPLAITDQPSPPCVELSDRVRTSPLGPPPHPGAPAVLESAQLGGQPSG
jgi:hypothetical protein